MAYEFPSESDLDNEREKFKKLFNGFCELFEFDADYDDDIIDDVNVRVHQRICYTSYFYNIALAETRVAGIRAYWTLRYRPLHAKTWNRPFDINVYFAVYMLFMQALGEVFIKSLKSSAKNVDFILKIARQIFEKHSDLYLRPFSEYDISKKSLAVIAEDIKIIAEYSLSNEQLRKENEILKEKNQELMEENEKLKDNGLITSGV